MASDDLRRLAVLGATGSIGRSALDVAARHPELFDVVSLAAHRDVDGLLELIQAHSPVRVALADAAAADVLRRRLADGEASPSGAPMVEAGPEAVAGLAGDEAVDTVVCAVVGAAGLASSLAAAGAGKRLLLANKESLVVAGELFIRTARTGGAAVLPVDSEHNGVFQCLRNPSTVPGTPPEEGVRELVLTASGGPFRERDPSTLSRATPEEACAHPNWSMGRKISVDSATMMNKGLEVIEAYHLFGLGPERIRVVVHPQSLIHAVVVHEDGTSLAHLGPPDMRVPIAYALGYPHRPSSGVEPLDLVRAGRMDFQAPDPERYPCLGLAYDALDAGGSACALLNAANEVAVAAFLDGRLRFDHIARVISEVLEGDAPAAPETLEAAEAADALGRERAQGVVERLRNH